MKRSATKWFVLLTLLAACGSDETNNQQPQCATGTRFNPISGECERQLDSVPNNTTTAPPDMGADTATEPDAAGEPDMTTAPDLGCQTDLDGDGAVALECGGDDCDDSDARRAPGLPEICDEVDNNCDGALNDGLQCSILAHSNTRLYRVDFFAGTYEDLGPTVGDLWDIDTHPDGTLYGIAGNRLHTYAPGSGQWAPAANTLGFLEEPNGFCIDNDGNAFVTSGFTNQLRSVDLTTGSTTTIGSMSPAASSGDCVVNKGNQLFMTSSHTTPDSFARIDGSTGRATIVGQTGYDGIWALTAAYNRVFGMTSEGFVVEINVANGSTTVIAHYPELSFYGAASTPGR